MKFKKIIKSEEGVTLIELLLATVMMALALAAFYALATQTFGIWSKSDKRSEVQQTAQITIEEMAREIRQATNNENYPVIISYAADSETNRASVKFYRSISTASFQFIRYRYAPATEEIIRETLEEGARPTAAAWETGDLDWQDSQVLAENISAFSITPQAKTFPNVDDSRSFLIDVEVSVASGKYSAAGEETMNLRTRINLRNF